MKIPPLGGILNYRVRWTTAIISEFALSFSFLQYPTRAQRLNFFAASQYARAFLFMPQLPVWAIIAPPGRT